MTLVSTTTTGSGGSYSFDNLDPGTYRVTFKRPAGHVFSPSNVGNDESKDSNAPEAFVVLSEYGEMDVDTIDAGVIPPRIDLDVDTNNNRTIGDGDEDDNETVKAKRVFVNQDDDDKNAIQDLDQSTPMQVADKDLVPARLSFVGFAGLSQGEWYPTDPMTVKIEVPSGLRIWGTTWKDHLSGNSSAEGTLTIEVETTGFPSLFIEGVAVGEHTLKASLYKANGELINDDEVVVSVEKVVWPFVDQGPSSSYPFNSGDGFKRGNAANWDGIAVAAGWYTARTLEDYLTAPQDRGFISTPYPDLPPEGNEPTERSTNKFVDSASTDSYQNGTLIVDYLFEQRGGNNYGYVQTNLPASQSDVDRRERGQNNDRTALSYVSNSGVKLGGDHEIAIIDTESLINLAGNQLNYTPNKPGFPAEHLGFDNTARLDVVRDVLGVVRDFQDEFAGQLVPGVHYLRVPYGQASAADYAKMKLLASPDPDSANFAGLLRASAVTQPSNGVHRMVITVDGGGLRVVLNGDETYVDPDYTGGLGKFTVQKHWGSGVTFTSINLVPPSANSMLMLPSIQAGSGIAPQQQGKVASKGNLSNSHTVEHKFTEALTGTQFIGVYYSSNRVDAWDAISYTVISETHEVGGG